MIGLLLPSEGHLYSGEDAFPGTLLAHWHFMEIWGWENKQSLGVMTTYLSMISG